ncbi:MAG TPA: phosphoribosylanthranilate isomerase [Syntrophomonadaceae bacterium]|nr:phosphoribosylanthranilate isomerase [Syntrophomonadaceae bacterium]
MTLVKICGIKNQEEAAYAVRYGAWAIGEVFAPSPRRITVEEAIAINYSLNDRIMKIGVFVNEKLEEVERIAGLCRLDMVQLHGDEPPEYVKELKLPVIKSFSLTGSPDPEYFRQWRPSIYLFDTFSIAVRGGSGQTFNWEWLIGLPPGIKFILAGGLNISNVRAAIQKLRPLAVDVSSGVEYPTGGKDPLLIEAFIREVKEADAQCTPMKKVTTEVMGADLSRKPLYRPWMK